MSFRENSLHHVVDSVEYQGIYFKVTLSPVAGEEFIIIEPDSPFFAHPVAHGDKVVAAWQPENAHLLDADVEEAGATQPYAEDGAN